MITYSLNSDPHSGWTWQLATRKQRQALSTVMVPCYGVALLFYRPERHLSVSFWTPSWSRNFRLFGPKKLSWEK